MSCPPPTPWHGVGVLGVLVRGGGVLMLGAPPDLLTDERCTRGAGRSTESETSPTSQFSNVKVGTPLPHPDRPLQGAWSHPWVTRQPPPYPIQGLLWKRLRERKGRGAPKVETPVATVPDGERYGTVEGGEGCGCW